MFFSQLFLCEIIIGKGIIHIYKYDQRNWPYPPPTTNFIVPKRSGTSIQTQCNSVYDAYVGAHDASSSGLNQSTNLHGNIDVKDNDDSRSFDTPRKNNCSSSCF